MRLICAALVIHAALAAAPRRLIINGSRVSEPESPGVAVQLRGFNFWVDLHHPLEAEDRAVSTLFPAPGGPNLARLVMVHWRDAKAEFDCYAPEGPSYLLPACLRMFDDAVAWATGAGMWAVLMGRAKGGEAGAVLLNATLAAQMVSMWGFLAARFANVSGVAGYEVMSEPRLANDDAGAAVIHAFQVAACEAAWAADPRAACFVGPGEFYNRYALDERYIIPRSRGPVVYAGNYLSPNPYIKGGGNNPKLAGVAYPSPPGTTVRCGDLLEKKDWSACPGGGNPSAQVSFDKALLEALAAPLLAFRARFDVPVWVDQFGLHGSVGGGNASIAAYLADALDIFERGGLLWTQWIWRDQQASGSANACSGFSVMCQPAGGCGPYYAQSHMVAPLSKYLGGGGGGVPAVPIEPPASALCTCIAAAEGICAASLQNASACSSCLWKHEDELIAQGCDWTDEHSDVIKSVCGAAPAPTPAPTPCTDIPKPCPKNPNCTCAQHKGWGHCTAKSMVGFCCKTCFNCTAGCGK